MRRFVAILTLFSSLFLSGILAYPQTSDDDGYEPLQLRREAIGTGAESPGAFDTATQARVVKLLLLFSLLNALWSAPPGSLMKDLANALRGPSVDNLFLPLDVRRGGKADAGLMRAYLRRATKRRVWFYTESPMARGEQVMLRTVLRGTPHTTNVPVKAVIRLVKRLADQSTLKPTYWYHVEARLIGQQGEPLRGRLDLPFGGLAGEANPSLI